MKTLTYLTTLLALTTQVMVNGQTQGNQTRKIRVDIMGAKEPIKMNYVNSNITLSEKEYLQLLEQANTLKVNAKQLRDEAISIEQQSLIKQIEASELSAQISFHKFELNRGIILGVFPQIPQNTITYTKAHHSYTESERFMKIAKEMREEGNAQLTIQAKYGDYSNAEEKEELALTKQQEALDLIAKTYPQLLQEKQLVLNKGIANNVSINHTAIADDSQLDQSSQLSNLLYETLKDANNLKYTAQELRKNATTSSPNEKQILINEAISFENDYLTKQLEISKLKSQLTKSKFVKNKNLINSLIDAQKDNIELVNKVKVFTSEAEYLLKISQEMREEGNAQLTVQAKYGAMSNAEEKEILALGKQYESIQTIEKYNSTMGIASR
ncbi:MAG: hypothetical protein KAZ71_02275 [Bacteroidia bacterium]|nr:hypothetical protein [Bacteroidia bacterium]